MTDDRHPAEIFAGEAAEGIRAVNHASFAFDSIEDPATIYRILGSLYSIAGRLDQTLEQLDRSLQRQLASGRLQVDPGAHHGNEPVAVAAAAEQLDTARQCMRTAHDALTNAQAAISGLYTQ